MKDATSNRIGLVLLAWATWLGTAVPVSGQQDNQDACYEHFVQAQRLFQAGDWDQVDAVIDSQDCFDQLNYASRDRKIETLLLMTELSLYRQEMEEAETYYSRILELQPNYEVFPDDGIELYYLSRRFETHSPLSLRFGAGLDFARTEGPGGFLRPGSLYGVGLEPGEIHRGSVPGFTGSVEAELGLSRSVFLTVGAGVDWTNAGYEQTLVTSTQPGFDAYTRVTYTEEQFILETPVGIMWRGSGHRRPAAARDSTDRQTGRGRLVPHVRLGVRGGYLFSASFRNISRVLSEQPAGSGGEDDPRVEFKDDRIDVRDQRNDFQLSVDFAAGVHWRFLSMDYVFMEVGYSRGLFNQVNGSTRFANASLIYAYGYLDDDFYTDHLSVRIGYVKTFQRVRQRKP